jgi:hypothetical protein
MVAAGSWFAGSAERESTLTCLFIRYAVERTDSFIKVWFWARKDGLVPADVANGSSSVDTDNWVSDNY